MGGTSDHVPDKGTLCRKVQNGKRKVLHADGAVLGVGRERSEGSQRPGLLLRAPCAMLGNLDIAIL